MRASLVAAALAIALIAPVAQAQQADATLAPSEYAARGMPAIDRDWTPADYTAAANALASLPFEQLPRSHSSKSGAVIDRIVNRSSFIVCQNQTVAVRARLEVCALGLMGLSRVLIQYGAAMDADLTRAGDSLRLINIGLYISAELSDMMAAYVPTLPDSDPRIAEVTRGRDDFAQILMGSVASFEAPAGVFPRCSR